MSTTLESLLSDDSDSRFTLLSVDHGASSTVTDLLNQFCKNHSAPMKYSLHLVSFALDFSAWAGNDLVDATLYDFRKSSFVGLADLIKNYTRSERTTVRNVVIIDDLELFLINADKDYGRCLYFFKRLTQIAQVFGVINRDSCSAKDLRFCYSQADNVITLERVHQPSDAQILCNVITAKPSGKLLHKQSSYNLANGKLCEVQKKGSNDITQNRDQNLSKLTTFKLTIEDEEKESRDRLHLPYFNAQSTTISTEETMFDDDEDDEEI